ncbi:hypothetical protein ACHAXH_009159 [Discostella pseudostelligera]
MVGNTSPFHTCIIEEETMAKKKSKSRASAEKAKHQTDDEPEQGGGDASSDDSSSSDDDSLVLEGVLVRNPDVSDSDDDDDDDDISSEEEETESTKKKAKKPTTTDTNNSNNASKKQSNKQRQKQPPSNKKQKQSPPEPETVQVEFLFCDMHTRFFHGIKTLLHRYGVHAPHSSQLADLIIENDMVGTVLSTDLDHSPNVEDEKKPVKKQKKQPSADAKSTSSAAAAAAASTSTAATTTSSYTPQEEANVFGFASIINFTTNHSNPCIQSLKSLILKHCPSQHKSEMTTVLSGNTARPVGFFFHERMVNVPLEITEVLHQQLILDMDYAINTADDEKERKSLDFGAFVRLAPCFYSREGGGSAAGGSGGGGGGVIYKYFDDEVFATNSEFVYNFEVAKHHNDDEDDGEKMGCSVIVLTKTGHRMAMKELKKMIHGG